MTWDIAEGLHYLSCCNFVVGVSQPSLSFTRQAHIVLEHHDALTCLSYLSHPPCPPSGSSCTTHTRVERFNLQAGWPGAYP
jgi:hypothetical protein